MAKQLLKELKNFIVSFCLEMKIKNVDIENISLDTSLDLDLNIFELDIDVFMSDFVKKFDIDNATFKWGKQFEYPCGEDMGLFFCIFRQFNYKQHWVKRICRKLYKPKLFVRDLQKAIEYRTFMY